MQNTDITQLIAVDADDDTPKYLQVSNGIIRAIEERKLNKGDQLPSLRQLSNQLDISFDTAKKAYDVLKKRSIVVAAHGKSNVINASGPLPAYKIFLLFNKLSSHKRIIYDSFSAAFTSLAAIDLFVYNNDMQLFGHLLKTKAKGYSHYVIIPPLAGNASEVKSIIDKHLSKEKLVLLDKDMEIDTPHASVHEDFENDIFNALSEAYPILSKYKTLNIIFDECRGYSPDILGGYTKFCNAFGVAFNRRTNIHRGSVISKGEVFIVLSDEDLADIIQLARSEKLEIGADIGIISYNETPLKQVLLNGITTISTDFREMGRLAAQQVISGSSEKMAVPFRLTLRPSL